MSNLTLSVSHGDALYDIVIHRFLDAYLFEQTVLDICKDVSLQRRPDDMVDESEISQISTIAELFHEEMLDVIYQFGNMSDFSHDDIVYAQEKWTQENFDTISGMVAQVLFKNQRFIHQYALPGRMDTISPYQNEVFPQMMDFALKRSVAK